MDRMVTWLWVALMCAACTVQTEDAGRVAQPDQARALAACNAGEVSPGTCALVAEPGDPCHVGGQLWVSFGGNAQAGVPMHTDELDGWVYTGPLAGETVRWVTTPGAPASWACSTTLTGPSYTVTGTW